MMSLSDEVQKFIDKNHLFSKNDKLLCAVSGGMDSMVLTDMLVQLNFQVHVGHVNYRLRGVDSDQDESFVRQYCKNNDLPFYSLIIDDETLNDMQKGNLQAKARKVRYDWLEKIRGEQKLDLIITAHHRDDVIETFFLNAIRGSGLTGLSSLKSSYKNIRRPLINNSRDEILQYSQLNNITYRVDRSNSDNKYDRNFLRNQIIPVLKKRWPFVHNKLARTIQNLRHDSTLLEFYNSKMRDDWLHAEGDQTILKPLDEFMEQEESILLGYHILKEHGFSYDQAIRIFEKKHESGRIFYSDKNIVCIDRNRLILRKSEVLPDVEIIMDQPGNFEVPGGILQISKSDEPIHSDNPNNIYIDSDKVQWPIQLRNWKPGDRIRPLGMNGQSKKVSDILIDNKLSLFEKGKQLIICDSTDEIIWVIGLKISDSVRYEGKSTSFLKLEWVKL